MNEHLWFTVLGPIRAWRDHDEVDVGPPQRRALLAALLLNAGNRISIDQLVDMLWGAEAPRTGNQTIRTYIYHLRRMLARAGGSPIIDTAGDGYVMRVAPEELDLGVFRQRTAQAETARHAGDVNGQRTHLRGALALWTGAALSGVDGRYAELQRANLERQRLDALEALLTIDVRDGSPAVVTAEISAIVAEHPLDERFRRLLMLALYRSGQQAEALAVYRDVQRMLAEELGVDPGRELQELYLQILRADPATLGARPAAESLPDRLAPAQLPADPQGFTGRVTELQHLDDLLRTQGQAHSMVIGSISGMAGAGKTTLAIHWAQTVADRFPDGQVYLNLRGFDPSGDAVSAGEALRILLETFGTRLDQIPACLDAQTALYRSLLAGKRVLILLDNARSAEQVRPLLPGTSGALVLVTSRTQMTSLIALDQAQPLSLDVLDHAEAHDFLVRRLGSERTDAEPDQVDEMITLSGGLPLALAIVAARAAVNPDASLASVVAKLCTDHGTLESFSDPDTAIDVRAIFSWSYEQLSPEAARLFRLMALRPGPGLALTAAASEAALPIRQTRVLAGELSRAHLIRETTPGRFAMHDLLCAYARELSLAIDSAAERTAVLRRLLDHYIQVAARATQLVRPQPGLPELAPPEAGVTLESFADQEEAGDWLMLENRAMVTMISEAITAGLDTQAWQLAAVISDDLQRRGHWRDQIGTQLIALEAGRRLDDLRVQASAHRSLGSAYSRVDELRPAEANLERALELFEQLGDRVGQARSHRDLAYLHAQSGEYKKSLSSAMQALAVCRLAGDEVGEAKSLNDCGWCYALLGDYETALDHSLKAQDLFQRLRGPDGDAATWDSLGYIYHRLGDQEQAEACYRRAVRLFRRLGDRYNESLTLDRLGDYYEAMGEPEAAVRNWSLARHLLDELGHPSAKQVHIKLEEAAA